jgi:hypothetical protein
MSFGESSLAELGAHTPQLDRSERRQSALARRELARWQVRLGAMELGAWAFQPRTGEGGRWYLRLPSPQGCETWLIYWPPGSAAPLHDHGDASAVALVLRGELRERACAQGEWFERSWQAQSSVELPKHIRHTVWNEGKQAAYSVHVYAPGLASMTYYEHSAGGILRAIRTEESEAW